MSAIIIMRGLNYHIYGSKILIEMVVTYMSITVGPFVV